METAKTFECVAGKPLAGMTVVDLSSVIAGPFATAMLAEYGADVWKIESAEGDISRRAGHGPEPGMSALFQHINREKKSAVLDLKSDAGRHELFALIARADAFVSNIRPDALERLGLDHAAVMRANPSIVYCSVTGYGTNGPYRGRAAYDDLIQGLSGLCDVMGRASGDGVPRFVPMSLADRIVGLYAAGALLSALLGRARTGRGAHIEVPMLESMVHFVMGEHLFGRSFDPPQGTSVSPRVAHPSRRPYRTQDGYLCVLPYSDRNWKDLFEITGAPQLASDPRFATFAGRLTNPEPLNRHIAAALGQQPTAHWIERFRAADIASMPMHQVDEVPSDEHVAAVGMFQPREMGGYRFVDIRSPVLWDGHPVAATGKAPRLGEHTEALKAAIDPRTGGSELAGS